MVRLKKPNESVLPTEVRGDSIIPSYIRRHQPKIIYNPFFKAVFDIICASKLSSRSQFCHLRRLIYFLWGAEKAYLKAARRKRWRRTPTRRCPPAFMALWIDSRSTGSILTPPRSNPSQTFIQMAAEDNDRENGFAAGVANNDDAANPAPLAAASTAAAAASDTPAAEHQQPEPPHQAIELGPPTTAPPAPSPVPPMSPASVTLDAAHQHQQTMRLSPSSASAAEGEEGDELDGFRRRYEPALPPSSSRKRSPSYLPAAGKITNKRPVIKRPV